MRVFSRIPGRCSPKEAMQTKTTRLPGVGNRRGAAFPAPSAGQVAARRGKSDEATVLGGRDTEGLEILAEGPALGVLKVV